jgi:hypothetical protein
MAFPSAVTYIVNVYTTARYELRHARKAWPGPLVDLCLLFSLGKQKINIYRRLKLLLEVCERKEEGCEGRVYEQSLASDFEKQDCEKGRIQILYWWGGEGEG